MIKVLLSILGLSYLLSPYDLLPDFLVGFGWLDDLAVLGALWWYLYVYRRGPYGHQQRERAAPDGPGSRESQNGGDADSKEEKSTFAGPKDPYTVLKVDHRASQREIRDAYLELVHQYHPDKVSHLGEEFRDLAEKRFKEIQKAYEALRVK